MDDDDAIMTDAVPTGAAAPGVNDVSQPSSSAKNGEGGADEETASAAAAAAAAATDATALPGIDNLQLQDSQRKDIKDDKCDEDEVIQDSDDDTDDDDLPPLVGKASAKAGADADGGGEDNNDDDASTSSTADEKEGGDKKEKKDSNNSTANQQADDDYLCQASIFKEEGNDLFKKGEMDDAARKYRKGMNRLQKIKSPLGQEQVQSLKLNLCTNLTMVYAKQKKHRQAVEIATRALKLDATHVKALYRRAVSNRQLGDLDASRDDLKLLLTLDANNVAAKKELAFVKRDLTKTREAQKKQLAKAFGGGNGSSSNGGAGLYDDKEELERRREAEAKRKQQEQEEYAKKRKLQWEDECVSRMAKNEPAVSFDEWEKEQEEKDKLEEKRKKAEGKKQRAERKKAQAAAKAASSSSGDGNDSDDSDKLTESELASLRGYKRTKDGRVTSYFTRELSDAERQQIGDIAPKKLDPATACTNNNVENNDASASSTAAAPLRSAWNQAGTTWEEKDCTKWCMDQLRTRLQETTITSRFLDADVTKVDDLTGEASVAVVQSKTRYIFDFHASCEYEMADLNDGTIVAKGKLRLPDICTSHEHHEYDVLFDAWTQAPRTAELEEKALETRKVLADGLRTNIKKWLQDFNEQY